MDGLVTRLREHGNLRINRRSLANSSWTSATQLTSVSWLSSSSSRRAFSVETCRPQGRIPARPQPRRAVKRGPPPRSLTLISMSARLWARFQVELHGEFSDRRLRAMQDYSRRQGRVHVALVCVLTLLPASTILTLLDIVPLASVKEGSNRNYIFWIRLVLAVALMVAGVVQHFCCCLPGLAVCRTDLIVIGIFGSGTGTLFCWALSQAIGIPVPFTMVIQSALTIPTIVLSLRMIWRRALRSNQALQKALRAHLFVFAGQCCMTYTYALFFFVFTSLNSFGQSVFTFALPLIKFGLKNYMSRALRQSYDVKPAFIVFNVDLFSSLYVVSCLQASQFSINTVLIMFVDIIQIAISIWDINFVLREIDSLLPPGQHRQSLFDLHAKITAKSGAKPSAAPRADGPSRDLIPTQSLESVAPVSSESTCALDLHRNPTNASLARSPECFSSQNSCFSSSLLKSWSQSSMVGTINSID